MRYFLDEKEITLEELDDIVDKTYDYIAVDRISKDKTDLYFFSHVCKDNWGD